MPITYILNTAPVDTLVTLEDAKDQMYVDHNDDDAYIKTLINLAERAVETCTDIYLGTQTFTLYLDFFPNYLNTDNFIDSYSNPYSRHLSAMSNQIIKILNNPVQSITTVKYIDVDGVQQTLAASEYKIDINSQPARLVPAYGKDWPSTRDEINAVEIQFICGYATLADLGTVKPMIAHAVKLLVAEWYENREAAQDIKLEEIPHGVKMLLGMSTVGTYI